MRAATLQLKGMNGWMNDAVSMSLWPVLAGVDRNVWRGVCVNKKLVHTAESQDQFNRAWAGADRRGCNEKNSRRGGSAIEQLYYHFFPAN